MDSQCLAQNEAGSKTSFGGFEANGANRLTKEIEALPGLH